MRLVLLALLDRAVVRVQVLVAGEALDGLPRQVAVRHRVAQHGDALARLSQQASDVARGLALARAGAHRADRDDRSRGAQHRLARGEQAVRRARRERARAEVHDVLVRHVGVGEDDLVDGVLADRALELGFGEDRDAVRVGGPGELRRVHTAVDVRDLRRGEGNDLDVGAAAVDDVEVVKVASRCARDENSGLRHEAEHRNRSGRTDPRRDACDDLSQVVRHEVVTRVGRWPGTLSGMTRSAARIDRRLGAALVRADDGTRPIAEVWRAVGEAARRSGAYRPSYECVRTLVSRRRAAPRSGPGWTFEVELGVALRLARAVGSGWARDHRDPRRRAHADVRSRCVTRCHEPSGGWCSAEALAHAVGRRLELERRAGDVPQELLRRRLLTEGPQLAQERTGLGAREPGVAELPTQKVAELRLECPRAEIGARIEPLVRRRQASRSRSARSSARR